jgi:hypothetical protein
VTELDLDIAGRSRDPVTDSYLFALLRTIIPVLNFGNWTAGEWYSVDVKTWIALIVDDGKDRASGR